MSEPVVVWEVRGHTGVIRLNRPAVHNVVNFEVLEKLEEITAELDRSQEIRTVIITGTGEKTFCAGGDLKFFSDSRATDEGLELCRQMELVLARWSRGPQVIIAAVNGQALGGGCEILTACHLRLAADHSRFSFRQSANGITTGWGGGVRLYRILGRSRALDLLLTARTIDAHQALQMGFVNYVFPGQQLMAEAEKIGDMVAKGSQFSQEAFLKLAHFIEEKGWDAARAQEKTFFAQGWYGPDFQRALERFANRGKS